MKTETINNAKIHSNSMTEMPKQADKATFVELSKIPLTDTFRCREQEDCKTVDEYAAVFKDYKKAAKNKEKPKYPFPPIWIWKDKEQQYHIVAGFHRYRAAEKAKITKILAKVFTGTKAEAMLFAIKDNRTHGLKMKYGDLKYAISKALGLSEGKTAGAIAKELGYTRSYVYRIEKELSTCGQLTDQGAKQGADGKVRKTTRKAKPKAMLDEESPAPSAEQGASQETIAQWKTLTPKGKSDFVNGTFDSIFDNIVNGMKNSNDCEEFADMVIRWAEDKKNRYTIF